MVEAAVGAAAARAEEDIDDETLWMPALCGSPIIRAAALTLLDEKMNGAILSELSRLRKRREYK